MYLEFALPTGSGGQAAQYAAHLIQQQLEIWAQKYNIKYHKKHWKYTVRVTFDDDAVYSFFAMTWAPDIGEFTSYLLNYRFVEPMKCV
jgi:hypothetical protein